MEKWDLYDRDRRPTGQTVIRGETLPEGTYHLIVDVLFLNSRGETLLQRRAKEKRIMPDLWSLTGGAVTAGEDSRAGMIRETEEEMGFTPDADKAGIIYSDRTDRPGRGFFRDVWLVKQDVPLESMRYQPEEVQDGMWILPEKIKADPALWAQLCEIYCWQQVYPLLLQESLLIRQGKT